MVFMVIIMVVKINMVVGVINNNSNNTVYVFYR